ncbi:MAG: SIR2 family protein [Motiliproteus sp.]|nr:SIR2 family protein [Motiliproteus sp.]MCW9053295.1 SIR2 family protein [Motiliproteus sp.]
MTNKDNQSLDGQLAYLKPNSHDWKPLTGISHNIISGQEAGTELAPEDQKKIADSKQYISDMLSGALQLPNLSFFSGSGASLAEVKGPSMWELWVQSMWAKPEAKEGKDGYDELAENAAKVCETVRYSELENPNIEHFLSQCDAYLLFNDDEEVSSFIVQVKKTILEACTSFLDDPNSDTSAYTSLLQKLARRRVRDPRLKVFTTNYDMCFETAASELGMMIVDGFSYTRNRRFDGRYFNYDVVRRDNESHEFVEGIFQLYKLHGSVSWERKDNVIYEKDTPDPANAALIYPAKGKYQQAFVQPHLELFSRFIEALRTPNNCLIVAGFGFNDDHLSEPIISAIKSNPSLKLIVADYAAASQVSRAKGNEGGVSPYWKELAELAASGHDIHLINSSFSGLVKLIPHLRALSPAEQLAKAVKQAGR